MRKYLKNGSSLKSSRIPLNPNSLNLHLCAIHPYNLTKITPFKYMYYILNLQGACIFIISLRHCHLVMMNWSVVTHSDTIDLRRVYAGYNISNDNDLIIFGLIATKLLPLTDIHFPWIIYVCAYAHGNSRRPLCW